jgi:hypothetical protein
VKKPKRNGSGFFPKQRQKQSKLLKMPKEYNSKKKNSYGKKQRED